jgi:hypothetical protein
MSGLFVAHSLSVPLIISLQSSQSRGFEPGPAGARPMNLHRSFVPSLALGVLVAASSGCGTESSTNEQGGVADASASSDGTAGATSGGGAGAGGATNGTGGMGGAAGAGQPNVTCTVGTVQFHVVAASGTDFCAHPACGMPDVGANPVVSVKPVGGKTMPMSGPCVSTCDCLFHACTCPAPQRLGSGQTFAWDGTFLASQTCGTGGLAVACYDKQCAPAGKYVATICAYPAPADAGANGCPIVVGAAVPTCVDVPFDYPSTATIEATLP